MEAIVKAILDFLKWLILLLMDRNRGLTLGILLFALVLFLPLTWRLDAAGARDVYLYFFGRVFSVGTLALIALNVFQFFIYRRQKRIYKKEIERLVRFKHWFYHSKTDPVAMKQLELFDDIEHHSAGFKLFD